MAGIGHGGGYYECVCVCVCVAVLSAIITAATS